MELSPLLPLSYRTKSQNGQPDKAVHKATNFELLNPDANARPPLSRSHQHYCVSTTETRSMKHVSGTPRRRNAPRYGQMMIVVRDILQVANSVMTCRLSLSFQREHDGQKTRPSWLISSGEVKEISDFEKRLRSMLSIHLQTAKRS